jgi:uncharacterized protein with WD repeat
MPLKKQKLTNVQKKVKALEKKLSEISQLRARHEAGETLDEKQLLKLASEEDVRDDLSAWSEAAGPNKHDRQKGRKYE